MLQSAESIERSSLKSMLNSTVNLCIVPLSNICYYNFKFETLLSIRYRAQPTFLTSVLFEL